MGKNSFYPWDIPVGHRDAVRDDEAEVGHRCVVRNVESMQAVKAASAAIAAVEAASQVVAGLVAKPEKIIILLQAKSVHLYLHTYVLPPTPTDGMARIFSLTPMQWPGIELTLFQLHLF